MKKSGAVALFGDDDHVLKEEEKLINIRKQSYSKYTRRVFVERVEGIHFFHPSVATLAAGLHIYNCGHQFGDV